MSALEIVCWIFVIGAIMGAIGEAYRFFSEYRIDKDE